VGARSQAVAGAWTAWCATSFARLQSVTVRVAAQKFLDVGHPTCSVDGAHKYRVCVARSGRPSLVHLSTTQCVAAAGAPEEASARRWLQVHGGECLDFCECVFACDGEDALPRMDTLVNLSSYHLWNCPSLRVLPASLWRLPQLRGLHHHTDKGVVTGAARSELPVAGLPLSAPCFASMHGLSLSGHNLPAFPLGILSMACLVYLNLSHSCFEQLPEGVSVLTALEELRLGRHSAGAVQVGGALDARALGGLAGLPNLRELGFANCSVLLCSSFQAAAAHPRLERVQLDTSHPAPGLSCTAFLGFVSALLQRGRPTVLELTDSVVQGAGRRDSRDFRGALRAVGYPLSDSDSADLV